MNHKQTVLIALGATIVCGMACPTPSFAEQIACATEVPAARKGHWYYRIIDGRKCWYEGKPMMPKTSLYWPGSAPDDAVKVKETKAEPGDATPATLRSSSRKAFTDGRGFGTSIPSAQPAEAEQPAPEPDAAPVIPPAPAANEISFESRWLGLHSR
jgi:hypothetical protein